MKKLLICLLLISSGIYAQVPSAKYCDTTIYSRVNVDKLWFPRYVPDTCNIKITFNSFWSKLDTLPNQNDTVLVAGTNIDLIRGNGPVITISSTGGFSAYPPANYIPIGSSTTDSMTYDKLGNFQYDRYSSAPNFYPYYHCSFPGDTTEMTLDIRGNRGDIFHAYNHLGDIVYSKYDHKGNYELLLSNANPNYTLVIDTGVFSFSTQNIDIGALNYVFPQSLTNQTFLKTNATGGLSWSPPYITEGSGTLSSGSLTVSIPSVTSSSIIILQRTGTAPSLGMPALYYSATSGSFTVTSGVTGDNGTFIYIIDKY